MPFNLPTQPAFEAMTCNTSRPLHENADYAHHLATLATAPSPHGRWFLRLLPGALGARLDAWLAARRHEKTLIALWQNSPHLLADIGVTLTRGSDLPAHLTAAPPRLIDLVAAEDPDQIVRAERAYPPRSANQPATTDVISFDTAASPQRRLALARS